MFMLMLFRCSCRGFSGSTFWHFPCVVQRSRIQIELRAAVSGCSAVSGFVLGSTLSKGKPLPVGLQPVQLSQVSAPIFSSAPENPRNLDSFLNAVTMTSLKRRWFDNPYPDYQAGGSNDQVNLEGVRRLAIEKLEQVLGKGIQNGDGGVYVGSVGCTYMLLHVLDKLTEDERRRLMPVAINAYQIQSMYFSQNPGPRNDEPAFLLGKAGHYAVGAVLGQVTGNQQLTDECLHRYVAAAEVCKPIDFFRNGGDELFVGRAGYLCGALWLQQKLGFQPVPKEDLRAIWTAIVDSGKRYAKHFKSPCPLMYSYYDTEYLGAAHGLSAILQMLISFPTFLEENTEASNLIRTTIDFYLGLQDESGNFPCAMDEVGSNARRPEDSLVHWCHGAPGAIYLLAKAYRVYNDNKYLEACIKCGDLMWNKGLLRKGPGICHGVAGNGYVFLIINQLLEGKEPKHLYRAGKFAEFLENPQFLREARRPDNPFSLYEGWAGTVCYLMDLLRPESAEFPFFNFNVSYLG